MVATAKGDCGLRTGTAGSASVVAGRRARGTWGKGLGAGNIEKTSFGAGAAATAAVRAGVIAVVEGADAATVSAPMSAGATAGAAIRASWVPAAALTAITSPALVAPL